jgi:hypothetical protein
MSSDSAYFAKVLPIARLLIEASRGDFERIPDDYSDHLYHEYEDGCVSLVPAISRFTQTDELENWELDEAIELISKVEPYFWPDLADIESVDVLSLVREPEFLESEDFVEDNLGTSDKVQRVLSSVIESVFGEKVDTIRDRSGKFPSTKNNFLQDKDGTFSGTFKFNNYQFLFEILPTELGWVCTYRLDEKSLDGLGGGRNGNISNSKKSKQHKRNVRFKGWK